MAEARAANQRKRNNLNKGKAAGSNSPLNFGGQNGENIAPLRKLLSRLGAQKIDVIRMSQGQKVSRLLVWSFLADS